jgi:hypothetical protein
VLSPHTYFVHAHAWATSMLAFTRSHSIRPCAFLHVAAGGGPGQRVECGRHATARAIDLLKTMKATSTHT